MSTSTGDDVGQLLMGGFEGLKPPVELLERVRAGRLGGVVLFGRNVQDPDQVRRLTDALQNAAAQGGKPPLLIAIDHEGGLVQRLRHGVTALPSQMAVAATEDPDLARRLYGQAARELNALGINLNFAPVLDVNNNPRNPVIGIRSFGTDPEQVAHFGTLAFQAWLEGGVIPCGKHFPGHGDTAEDSHLTLPVVGHDRARLDAVELLPFRRVIAAGIPMLMTAHVRFPAVEPTGLPATLSPRVLTDLVRRELGFDGVVITDCLEMQAIQGTVGTVRGAVMAVAAGADLCLISHTPALYDQAYEALGKAVDAGDIAPARQIEAARRVARLKDSLRPAGPFPPPDARLAAEAFRRAVRVTGDRSRLPLTRPIALITFVGARRSVAEEGGGQSDPLVQRLKAAGLVAIHRELPADPDPSTIISVLNHTDGLPLVVVLDRAGQHPGQSALLRQAATRGPVYAVALSSPFDLTTLPAGAVGLTAADPTPPAQAALAEQLIGRSRQP
jgi:beta-N-acetylhexosaminidase